MPCVRRTKHKWPMQRWTLGLTKQWPVLDFPRPRWRGIRTTESGRSGQLQHVDPVSWCKYNTWSFSGTTYDGPVANNAEKDCAQKQEWNVNERIGQDEGQCSVKSIFGLAIEDGTFFQDLTEKSGYELGPKVGTLTSRNSSNRHLNAV